MKFCEECGAQLEDDAIFCEECGAQVDDTPIPAPVVVENKPSKSKLPIIIGAIGGVVLIVAIVIVVVFVLKKGKDEIPLVNSDATTLAAEVDTTEPSKENVTETPTTEAPTETPTTEAPTEIPTTQEPTTKERDEEYYNDFNRFINFITSKELMSWNGDGGQPIQGDALVSYQHEIYDGWKQGIAFDNVVIGEDGELHNEMLYSEYSVLIIKGKSGLGFDFELCIKKEVDEYIMEYIEYKEGQKQTYKMDMKTKGLYANEDNFAYYRTADMDPNGFPAYLYFVYIVPRDVYGGHLYIDMYGTLGLCDIEYTQSEMIYEHFIDYNAYCDFFSK